MSVRGGTQTLSTWVLTADLALAERGGGVSTPVLIQHTAPATTQNSRSSLKERGLSSGLLTVFLVFSAGCGRVELGVGVKARA